MYSRGAVAIMIASVTWLAGPAIAETYPTRTIRLIVPYAPGDATDVVGRRVGQRLSEVVGQSVVVENRPGGMENIGVRTCTDAAPDGYTLCLPTRHRTATRSACRRGTGRLHALPADAAPDGYTL